MKVRRVVTGHRPDGKSAVVSDTLVDGIEFALDPGQEHHLLWGADAIPTFPDDGSPPQRTSFFPPLNGFRFGLFTTPPASSSEVVDVEAAVRDVEEKFPGAMAHVEPNTPGIHTTNTIDFEYVVSGEVWLELDDGAEVCLRAGDTVVQNGTRHRWVNKGDVPCTMVLCMIGAHRKR